MARKGEGNFSYIGEESKATVRMFTLKKHEITMLAINEVEKLKNQLLFVSVVDYNRVVAENKRLREMLGNTIKENEDWVNKNEAMIIVGCKVTKLNSFIDSGQIRVRKSGKYNYYFRADLEEIRRRLDSGEVRSIIKVE